MKFMNFYRIFDTIFFRQLKLNAVPHSLEFVDTKGSLVVGIGKNLHKIDSRDSKCSSLFSFILYIKWLQ